jgi:HD-GYP domain-containing protein (c-di-GMP phosphodiesterase class II)
MASLSNCRWIRVAMGTQMIESEQRIALGRTRARERAIGRERAVEAATAISFLVVAVAMAVLIPSVRSFEFPTAALLIGAYVVTCRIQFEASDGGYTVPTQIILVPMLFVLPTPAVPLIVALSWLLGRLPDYVTGEASPHRAFHIFGDSWHAVGPALVLCAAGAQTFTWANWPIYLLALLAQFAFDIASAATRAWLIDGTAPRDQVRQIGLVFALDGALAPIGLLGAYAAVTVSPALCLMSLPLCVVLATLARERRARIDNALELSSAYRGTALLLGDVVEADDAYTGSHSRGVVDLALAVADRLRLDATQRRNVEFGALLHDVGKITVPKEIINKPGPLSDAEWAIMHRHTLEGERMLGRVGGMLGEVGRVVRSSHEHYDGNGYPDALAGQEIPIEARIISCCDAYSAMTTTRPYRRAMTVTEARAELTRCTGTQFDPTVAGTLLDLIETELEPV